MKETFGTEGRSNSRRCCHKKGQASLHGTRSPIKAGVRRIPTHIRSFIPEEYT